MAANEEKIGIVYHPDYLLHSNAKHPERKERLEQINNALEEKGLQEKIEKIEPLPADVEDIALVHDYGYIQSVEEACKSGKRFLDMDTYIVPESYRVALLSAGGALTGLKTIFGPAGGKTFVFNRPPGHHAERNRAMGFCLFNNVAVAAAVAKRDFGIKKIAIVDWDVHHGNGTQHTFEDDPEVLFISTHQSPAYPGTGRVDEVGRDEGEGFSVNIPLPMGSGDMDYAMVFEQLVIPVLDQYKPELVIISAGQDAYNRDPLAGMSLTEQGYYNMAGALASAAERWSQGRILLCLEGGYHMQGQAEVVIQILNALGKWGLPVNEQKIKFKPGNQAQRSLEIALKVQKAYWNL